MAPVGRHMANQRRKCGLGKDPERAAKRAQQLTTIDPDWSCPWPPNWQPHYRVLADLSADEPGGVLPSIAPGVVYDGDDIGTWRWREQEPGTWAQLLPGQQERLTALGVRGAAPAELPPGSGRHGKGSGKAWRKAQGGVPTRPHSPHAVERKGTHRAVPRGHSEPIAVDGQERPVPPERGS